MHWNSIYRFYYYNIAIFHGKIEFEHWKIRFQMEKENFQESRMLKLSIWNIIQIYLLKWNRHTLRTLAPDECCHFEHAIEVKTTKLKMKHYKNWGPSLMQKQIFLWMASDHESHRADRKRIFIKAINKLNKNSWRKTLINRNGMLSAA